MLKADSYGQEFYMDYDNYSDKLGAANNIAAVKKLRDQDENKKIFYYNLLTGCCTCFCCFVFDLWY